MSLRLRLTLFIGLVVALTVAAVSWVSYNSTANEAVGDIDRFLLERVEFGDRFRGVGPEEALAFIGSIPEPPEQEHGPRVGPGFARYDTIVQMVGPDGEITPILGDTSLPVDPAAIEAAADGPVIQDLYTGGVHYRVITVAGEDGYSAQTAREMTETDDLLASLRIRMWLIGSGGLLLAALGAWFVSRRALAPVGRLTDAAEHVAETGDLAAPIPRGGNDEVGRLAAAFNEMLDALDTSRQQQRRLVADAGHELRTPLTSMRTNLEVLARNADLDPEVRAEVMADLEHEIGQLSNLVAEVVGLAGDGTSADGPVVETDLAGIVQEAVATSARRSGRAIEVSGEAGIAEVRPRQIARAVANLLENAGKWSPSEEAVEVRLDGGRIEVLDRGPGIPEADLDLVFDRFHRSDEARTMPGSGLGLAIVRRVALDHGGSVWARNRAEGGAAVGFEVPLVEVSP